MKYILNLVLTSAFLSVSTLVLGCDVCQKQQPKILRGVTHGAGPQSEWDYIIVGLTALIAVVSLAYAIRWTIHPGEKDSRHIKRSVLNISE